MGLLGDATLEQLRNATVDQIRTVIKNKINNMTKKQLIILILKVTNIDIENWEEAKRVTSTGDARGQLLEVDEVKDVLGDKVGSKRTEYTYYPTGEVDTIKISYLNSLDQIISQKTIKHFTDGRQPVIP